jgi:pimeloyl-ACP methyl ester carboxylesterase
MNNRTPLLLLPGLLCDAALWDHQIRFLADLADIRVADLSQANSMTTMAAAALSAAPQRFALAGLSMGGYVSLEIMRQAPERVIKLALLDTGPRADTPEQTQRRRALMELAGSGRFEEIPARLRPLWVHQDRQADEELIQVITDMAKRVGAQGFLREQEAIMGRPDSRPGLPRISCPTLVLCGREDASTPLELSIEMASLIPNARLSVIEQCGHMSTMERPHAVTAMLRDWLLYS